MTETGVTEVLANFAVGEDTPHGDHAAEVSRALVDTVAVSVGAAGTDGERILRTWAERETAAGPATVWTSGRGTSASLAALVNGTAAHLLDYDDISPSMPLHPSAVLMPALVAVAETRDVPPERFVDAYDVGAATFRAVAEVLPQHVHYARGWHTTSTVGRVAVVAALARLVDARPDVARNALGIAASLVAGSRQNFGSMTKPLHAGTAARDGVLALELAEAGFTANPSELESAGGFLERYGDPDLSPVGSTADTLGERLEYWIDAWIDDWGLKRYPSCYATHRGIDAILQLRGRLAGRVPTSITATLHPRGTRALRDSAPATPTQAKFSLEYTLAAAYLRGDVALADFTDDGFDDPAVHALMGSVTVRENPVPPAGPAGFTTGYTVVQLAFADGTTASARVDVTHGQSSRPLTDVELRTKFQDCCAAGGLGAEETERLYAAVADRPGPAFTASIPRKGHR
ncbi:MmgE/PrpD family protein [Micromonospora eburnea]|uniref:2-methylcitrate dehydratase PrpD n=1 Tax=Micromonospora eburnea TaxID=227316 RepID=A0A1C6U9J7_9ACTN|nr:MmgE/PrpD family protein [Micromonospora eburnea]SCL50571.1 2-methylcitrate dehydratase PrpD [Micromonospora eburnea]